MITTENLTLSFGDRILFEDVNLRFTPGNTYGLIGANGAGKSTFIKMLAGEIESSSGTVSIPKQLRMSTLKQDHFAYDEVEALTAVLMGHERLFGVMQEKDAIYAKPDFSEEDGVRAGDLEAEFADLNGWEAESQAAKLLSGLGIPVELHNTLMKELDDNQKIRVLLAQALFGDPDILLLDEPTNHLDVASVLWLEDFLAGFQNTVIVVSHDRHFLNHVCTHIADIDFRKITLYTGNYDFWQKASELNLRQQREQSRKAEDKAKELKAFIARFSANASKSRQATARKKLLDKLDIGSIKPSTRKYPHIVFDPEPYKSRDLLNVKELAVDSPEGPLFKNVSFTIGRGEKVVFVADDSTLVTALFDVLAGAREPASGKVAWGTTVEKSYFPKDQTDYFNKEVDLVEWLSEFSPDPSESFVRSFLGRMLFSGDEAKKPVTVLSGGEKVRCMLSKLMLENRHTMILDGPTNHLDLESITALNRTLVKFPGSLLFSTHDVEFAQTIATRVIEIQPEGVIDRPISYEDYLNERAEQRGIALVA
ncbi:MAG: ATP-binding cassette domain-containing protein [Deltaproteobacteria bacterium]|nr:ATP-binding cassette domain-containing protein [Deltaproteobacteria bacterium]